MASHRKIFYHLVFGTRSRENTLPESEHRKLYNYFWGIFQNKQCHLYQINGTTNHLHFLFELHPSVSLASLVKDLKLGSSQFIKKEKGFPAFKGWQEGYGAFTKSLADKVTVVNYIKRQKEHHKQVDFRKEYRQLLIEHGVSFDERYLL